MASDIDTFKGRQEGVEPMKVKELLSKLRDFDPELDVVFSSEDESVQLPNHGFRLFDINGIDLADAEKTRGPDGIASLKFGKSDCSVPHVLIDISSDF